MADSGSRRVLVVDDNRDAADAVVALLKLLGHEARSAYDGPSALVFVNEFKPHVVLVDLVMSGMDGFEFAQRLRDLHGTKSPRIIALTGFGDPPVLDATSAAGFDAHLTKPATGEELARVVAG